MLLHLFGLLLHSLYAIATMAPNIKIITANSIIKSSIFYPNNVFKSTNITTALKTLKAKVPAKANLILSVLFKFFILFLLFIMMGMYDLCFGEPSNLVA